MNLALTSCTVGYSSMNWLIINYDPELFRADLNSIPCDIIELESDPENEWNSFKDLFMTAADCNTPVVNRRVRGRSLPWITPPIKDLMKKRDFDHNKAIKTNEELHWSSYQRFRNSVSMKQPAIIQISYVKNRTRVNCGKV